jgi:hypothetical protein
MYKNTIKHSKATKKQLVTIQKSINHVTIQGIYKTDTSNQLLIQDFFGLQFPLLTEDS